MRPSASQDALRRYVRDLLVPAERSPQDLGKWTEGLCRWGSSLCLRAAAAACVAAYQAAPVESRQDPGFSGRHEEGKAAITGWLLCPCEEREQMARAVALQMEAGPLPDHLAATYFGAFATSMASIRGQCCSMAGMSVEVAARAAGSPAIVKAITNELLSE